MDLVFGVFGGGKERKSEDLKEPGAPDQTGRRRGSKETERRESESHRPAGGSSPRHAANVTGDARPSGDETNICIVNNRRVTERQVPGVCVVNSTHVQIGNNFSVVCQPGDPEYAQVEEWWAQNRHAIGAHGSQPCIPILIRQTENVSVAESSLQALSLEESSSSFTVIQSEGESEVVASSDENSLAKYVMAELEPEPKKVTVPKKLTKRTQKTANGDLATFVAMMWNFPKFEKLPTVDETFEYHRQKATSREEYEETQSGMPMKRLHPPVAGTRVDFHWEQREYPMRLCLCHKETSLWRMCDREVPVLSDQMLKYSWERLEHGFLDEKSVEWLRDAIVMGCEIFIQDNVGLDCQAAQMYLNLSGERFDFDIVTQFARESSWLNPNGRQWFELTQKMRPELLDPFLKESEASEARFGLLSIMTLLEICSHGVCRGDGRLEEGPLAIFARFAGTCAQVYTPMLKNTGQLLQCDCGGSCKLEFDQVAWHFSQWCARLHSRTFVPSLTALCHMGLDRELPLVESVICEDIYCHKLEVVLESFKMMIENGVSYSLNICSSVDTVERRRDRRVNGFHLIDVLETLHETIPSGRIPSSGRVYLDLWDMVTYQRMQRMGPRSQAVKYAVWVPDVFMKRVADNTYWTFFFRDESAFLRSTTGRDFQKAYEGLEKSIRTKLSVPANTVWRSLEYLVLTHDVAILFRDHMVSPWKETYNLLAESQGPEVASDIWMPSYGEGRLGSRCTHERGFNGVPVQRFSVNVYNFVKEIGPETSVEPIMSSVDGRWFFDFDDFARAVESLVQLADAAMEQSGDFDSFGELETMEYSRPLHLDMTGLHSACIAMGYWFDSPIALELSTRITELMYYTALRTSMQMCSESMKPFGGFRASKYADGWLHQDEYQNVKSYIPAEKWTELRQAIKKTGLRHSKFLSFSLNEQSGDLANVSPGCWPTKRNVGSVVRPFAGTGWTEDEIKVSRGMLLPEHLRQTENPVEFSRRVLGPKPLRIPKVNLELKRESFEISKTVVDLGQNLAARLSSPSSKEKKWIPNQRVTLYKQRHEIRQTALLEMCIERAPFVDHCQAIPFDSNAINGVSLEWFLKKAHQGKLKVAVASGALITNA